MLNNDTVFLAHNIPAQGYTYYSFPYSANSTTVLLTVYGQHLGNIGQLSFDDVSLSE